MRGGNGQARRGGAGRDPGAPAAGRARMTTNSTITVHFFQPSPALRAYFTAFYLTEIEAAPGVLVAVIAIVFSLHRS